MRLGLALKGGGLRGEVTLRILSHLCLLLGKPIQQKVSMGAGTSTGGIILMLLFCMYQYTPDQIEAFYRKLGKKVFPWQLLGSARQLYSPKHDIRVLMNELASLTNGGVIGNARIPLLWPTADANTNQPVHLKSYMPEWELLPFHVAATATAAAPTYFKALASDFGGWDNRFIDGGLYSGNPASDLLSEMDELFPGEEKAVLAIGTGRPSKALSQPWPDGGLIAWGPIIFNACSILQDKAVAKKLERRLEDNYVDLDVDLDRIPPMDDSSDSVFDYLATETDKWIKANPDKIDRALDKLTRAQS